MKERKHIPPHLATRLLRSFLRDDLLEEVNGDLEEKFYKTLSEQSLLRARMNYWYQVVKYVRPFAIRRSKSNHINQYAMFQNYFKIGWRNLLRNKGYSLINIGGLALGMSVALLIALWIIDELSFNHYHTHYDRVVQVMQHQTADGKISSQISIPMPLGNALKNEYGTDFTHIALASWSWDHILSTGDQKISKRGMYVQQGMPEILSLRMLSGSRDALKDPASILLSASSAHALFGDTDAIGKAMRIDNKLDVKVGGVYEDVPYNSAFFDEIYFLAGWELYLTSETWLKRAAEQWDNNSFQLFAQVAPLAHIDAVSAKIKKIKAAHIKDQNRFNPEIYLHPMADWHLRSNWKNGVNTGGRIQMVWLFGIIGVFVLLLACINFMNLSTARSEKRSKEVGIRMTIGSVRSQLINQFLSESFLVVLFAFVLTLGVVFLSLPWFNDLTRKQMIIPWSNPVFWMWSALFTVITSLLAGSYPALYLSSFRPVNVLKGTFKIGRFASLPRKVLVVIQFTVSITLVIGTIIVYQQIQFSKSRPTGYEREGLVMISMMSPEFFGKGDVLRTELKTANVIEELAEASSPMSYIGSNSGGFGWEGKDPNLQSDFGNIWVTPEYGKTVNWKIKQGRDFSRDRVTDSSAVILNEAAVKYMNVKDPVGMEITWGTPKYQVVGVVEDMVVESPYKPIRPTVYFMSNANTEWYFLKLNPNKNTSEAMAAVEAAFKKYVPSAPFNYTFADETYAKKFATEERVGKLAYVFASLAIFISCLGLFGLASFIAEQRTKEIGIRKVLGASVTHLWIRLSADFVWLVVIACAVAVPIAYYYLQGWLQEYEYRTEISWWIVAITMGGALGITLLTVSYQAIRAAIANPVKSLRSE